MNSLPDASLDLDQSSCGRKGIRYSAKTILYAFALLICATCSGIVYSPQATAQEQENQSLDLQSFREKYRVDPNTEIPEDVLLLLNIEQEMGAMQRGKSRRPRSYPSLFFTDEQFARLREARAGFRVRVPELKTPEKTEQPGEVGTENILKDIPPLPEIGQLDPPDLPRDGPGTQIGLPRLPDTGAPDRSRPDKRQRRTSNIRKLNLGGIVYLSNNDWIVWLNSQRVTPSRKPEQLKKIKVFENFVEVQWYDPNTNKIYPVRLRPNQTFNIDLQTFQPG